MNKFKKALKDPLTTVLKLFVLFAVFTLDMDLNVFFELVRTFGLGCLVGLLYVDFFLKEESSLFSEWESDEE